MCADMKPAQIYNGTPKTKINPNKINAYRGFLLGVLKTGLPLFILPVNQIPFHHSFFNCLSFHFSGQVFFNY